MRQVLRRSVIHFDNWVTKETYSRYHEDDADERYCYYRCLEPRRTVLENIWLIVQGRTKDYYRQSLKLDFLSFEDVYSRIISSGKASGFDIIHSEICFFIISDAD